MANDKYNFAETINGLGGMPPMSECFNYGMTWGCDLDCPVIRRGECEIQNSENIDIWNEIQNETRYKLDG